MAIVNQHINEFLDYYIDLDDSQYAILLSGKWGSGKTFFINQVTKKYQNTKNIVKVSLFGLKSKEDIHKKVLLKLFNIDDTHDVSVTAKLVGQVLKKFTGINLSDMPMGWALKQEGNQNAIFIFDDLERTGIELLELHGYINELTETYKQKVILLADEDKLKEDEKYMFFKEKTIGKTFAVEQDFETAFKTFTAKLENSKDILHDNQSGIKTVFDQSKYQNLRSLRQGILDFDRLIGQFEQKFKDHSELMAEFIQIFFALLFEIKSGKFDIQKDLRTRHEVSMYWSTRDNKSDKQELLIEAIYHKYNFLDDLLLSKNSWIKLFTTHNLLLTEVSEDFCQSRYFLHEQQAEWKKLWHFMYLEQEEFQNAFDSTLEKLQNNEYLEPTVILHITGILLELIDKGINGNTKDQIVLDIKKCIDLSLQKLKGMYTLNDNELDGHYTGYGYRSEDSDEFKQIKDYLLKKADNVRNEGLDEKGRLLIQYLSENKIYEFADMLTAERNKEILYRLPVFNAIESQEFFDALLQVENKNMRDVLDILKNRYQSLSAYQKESVLEELSFWKSLIEIVNSYEVKKPYKIKDVWIKKHCHDIVEKEIIQKIEKQLQQIEKEKNYVE